MVAVNITPFFLGFAASALAYATNFDVYSDTGCQNFDVTYETDVSGGCYEIPGYGSVHTDTIESGCSLTVYTDSDCSDNAITAGVGACVASSIGFYSYSVDC